MKLSQYKKRSIRNSQRINCHIYTWTFNKIKSKPNLYGGDKGNGMIQLAYIHETNRGELVESLTQQTLSQKSTVVRCRNVILKSNPELDSRVKYKAKKTIKKVPKK